MVVLPERDQAVKALLRENMLSENLLMIFVRNPELGKVKTRLAKTLGNEKALKIYLKLIEHTISITKNVKADKAVFYSNFIDDYDNWSNVVYNKFIQEGGDDLGVKMKNAFQLAFNKGYKKVIIIGSDCIELTTDSIDKAFLALNNNDVVIGPAKDGGYYLLGMKCLYQQFFEHKEWSTENVFLDTLLDIEKSNLFHCILQPLSDIDFEEDLHSFEV